MSAIIRFRGLDLGLFATGNPLPRPIPADPRIAQHQRLARGMAKKYLNRVRGAYEIDDLINYANEAIWQATLDFDPKAGITFGQWARFKIRGALRRLQEKAWRGMRVGFVVSMHYQDDESRGLGLPCPLPGPERLVWIVEVRQLIARLESPHREVLQRRIFDEDTLAEVGADMGLTRERVRQLEVDALRILERRITRGGKHR